MAQIESFLEVGQRGATTLALVLGGLWAYYKYIRGRVFSHRLELTIEGRLLEREAVATLSLEVRVKNVGLARFVIDQERTLLRLLSFTMDTSPTETITAEWSYLGTFDVLSNHRLVEAGETVTDTVLIALPATRGHLFKLDLYVVPHKRIRLRHNVLVWHTASIVSGLKSEKKEDGNGSH